MQFKKLISCGIVLGSVAILSACGSSSSEPGNSGTTTTTGAITAFGSIYVNGREIEIGDATIYIEGQPATEDDLRVGMVVEVSEDGDGVATCVNHDNELEGLVTNPFNATDNSIEVMGQKITIDENTIFESNVTGINDITQVITGNIVEVSGYSAGMGDVAATRVEVNAATLSAYLSAGNDAIELKGTVMGHNAAAKTFTLGAITVDYNGAILDDISSISDGMYVEVYSTVELDSTTGNLIASKVELERGKCDSDSSEDDELEVHGKVVAVTDTSITVDSYTFIITDETEFEDDDKAGVMVGTMVEVEGYYNTDKQLIAKQVEIEEYDAVSSITDTIVSITPNAGTDSNSGTILLTGGLEITVNADTIMYDDSSASETRFNLRFLTPGDTVEINYVTSTNVATKVERKLVAAM